MQQETIGGASAHDNRGNAENGACPAIQEREPENSPKAQ
jgi:hypothetical protein